MKVVLSSDVNALLGDTKDLAEGVIDLLAADAFAGSFSVIRVSETIVVKITNTEYAVMEIATLQYLQQQLSAFPTSIPHGLIEFGPYGVLFTSLIAGMDLEKVWGQLQVYEKRDISSQLDSLLKTIRQIPFTIGSPLGDVNKHRCRDIRRFLRQSSEPITSIHQFQEFIFSGATTASPMFIDFLRNFMSKTESKCVFTHGDIRPANILVQRSEASGWEVTGIIGWEGSGFYPDYWEAIKITNSMVPSDADDWYQYLPESVSPLQFPEYWLLDRILDRNMNYS